MEFTRLSQGVRGGLIGLVLALLATPALPVHAQATGAVADGPDTRYTETLLAPPRGYSTSRVVAINDKGHVLGAVSRPGEDQTVPVVWRRDRAQLLRLPRGAVHAAAHDMNNSGVVVGEATRRDSGESHAVIWVKKTPRWLPVPQRGDFTDDSNSAAYAVNDKGAPVGTYYEDLTGDHIIAWPVSAHRTGKWSIGEINGAVGSDVNNAGVVVAARHAGAAPPILWLPSTGRTQPLETSKGEVLWASAWGINDRGAVIGGETVVTGRGQENHALMWAGRRRIVLPALDGDGFSRAVALNDRGVIIGVHEFDFQNQTPVLWSESQIQKLPFEGSVKDLNNSGVIAGESGGEALVWTPAMSASKVEKAEKKDKVSKGKKGRKGVGR